jgi:hypothetical protein
LDGNSLALSKEEAGLFGGKVRVMGHWAGRYDAGNAKTSLFDKIIGRAIIGSLLALFFGCNLPILAAQITFQTEAGRPRIVSTTPQNHATGVLTNINPIQVTFDSDMD